MASHLTNVYTVCSASFPLDLSLFSFLFHLTLVGGRSLTVPMLFSLLIYFCSVLGVSVANVSYSSNARFSLL